MKRKDRMRNIPTTNDYLSDINTDCCKGKDCLWFCQIIQSLSTWIQQLFLVQVPGSLNLPQMGQALDSLCLKVY